MRVKTFQGRSLEEVLPEIREELGPNAVVLSQRPLIAGGVGGFFGKRMIEVVATDRMPSDDELIELEERHAGSASREAAGSGASTTSSQTTARPRVDVVDNWDPASDDELAEEYGDVLQRAMENVTQSVSGSGAGMPAAGDRRLQTTPYGQGPRLGASVKPAPAAEPAAEAETGQADEDPEASSGGRVRQGADASYEPLDLPARSATVSSGDVASAMARARELTSAKGMGELASMAGAAASHAADTTPQAPEIHRQEEPAVQASKLAARAHQAIADATREIEDQLAYGRSQRAADAGMPATFRAEVMPSTRPQSPGGASAIAGIAHDLGRGEAPEQGYLIGSHVTATPEQTARRLIEQARGLERELAASGVDADVAQAVVSKVVSHRRPFSPQRPLRDLARDLIAEIVRVETGWDPVGRAHRLAVVGPSGAGKSTVIAKLHEGYARLAGLEVGVVSVVAGSEGVQSRDMRNDPLLSRADVDVKIVATPEQTLMALERLSHCDVVMIDTPSSAYLNAEAFADVARCLTAANVDDVHAVIPMAMSVREAESVVDHFRRLHLNRLIVSKIDESRYAGQLLNFGFRFGLPITFLSDGPRVPEDLRAASAAELAALIVPHEDTDHDTHPHQD